MKSNHPQARAKARRNQVGSSAMCEFAVGLFVFFCMVLFPLINLLAAATAAATGYLIATQAAGRAAEATVFSNVLASAAQQTTAMSTSGFGQFAHLKPMNGISGSGVDIYIHVTSVGSDQSTVYGPNVPLSVVDTTSNVYECEARTHFLVYPFVNLSAVPFIGDVPLVGRPVEIKFSCLRSAEYPMALLDTGSGPGPGDILNQPGLPPINAPLQPGPIIGTGPLIPTPINTPGSPSGGPSRGSSGGRSGLPVVRLSGGATL
jgi:hypothetical protein